MTDETVRFERHFRAVLGHFATGVAIVTGMSDDTPVGMTVQSFCSLSIDPPLFLLCPGLTSTSWPRIQNSKRLCINLLAEGQAGLARNFARSGGDKYAGVGWRPGAVTGSPVLDEALAWIEGEIESVSPGGDHLIAVCRVLDLESRTDLRPLVFFQSGFQRLIDPAAAPLGDVRSVVLSVSDMDAACRYYGDGLGFALLFRDGDSWAVFGGGHFNVALAGADRQLAGEMAVNVKVADVEAALQRASRAGGTIVEQASRGEHEVRGAFRDPEGHIFYVYAPVAGS